MFPSYKEGITKEEDVKHEIKTLNEIISFRHTHTKSVAVWPPVAKGRQNHLCIYNNIESSVFTTAVFKPVPSSLRRTSDCDDMCWSKHVTLLLENDAHAPRILPCTTTIFREVLYEITCHVTNTGTHSCRDTTSEDCSKIINIPRFNAI
jgi:hypothetical protein